MKKKQVMTMVIIITAILLAVLGYLKYQGYKAEKAAMKEQQSIERYSKRYIIFGIGINRYEDNNEVVHYEDSFLKNENFPTFLVRFNEYMDANYLEIGDRTRYKEITMERLKKDYVNVAKELEDISGWLKESRAMENFDNVEDISLIIINQMREDGIWIEKGA